jgi:hypothetical protein
VNVDVNAVGTLRLGVTVSVLRLGLIGEPAHDGKTNLIIPDLVMPGAPLERRIEVR